MWMTCRGGVLFHIAPQGSVMIEDPSPNMLSAPLVQETAYGEPETGS